MSTEKTLLVLGGTGLVGSHVCAEADLRGYRVVSLSRRGKPTPGTLAERLDNVEWRAGDACDARVLQKLVKEVKPVAIVHAVGVLWDSESWLCRFNRWMSGCGSVPDPRKGTYANVVKGSAMNVLHALVILNKPNIPFIFVSADIAGWGFGDNGMLGRVAYLCAPPFLRRYCKAKMEVEDALLRGIGVPRICRERSHAIRPVVLRPGVVQVKGPNMPSVCPCVDHPIRAATLARAAVKAIEDSTVRGVYRYRYLEDLSSSL